MNWPFHLWLAFVYVCFLSGCAVSASRIQMWVVCAFSETQFLRRGPFGVSSRSKTITLQINATICSGSFIAAEPTRKQDISVLVTSEFGDIIVYAQKRECVFLVYSVSVNQEVAARSVQHRMALKFANNLKWWYLEASSFCLRLDMCLHFFV
jgi:hypothetical protein